MRTCASCGIEIPSETATCPGCGAKLGEGAPPHKRKKWSWLLTGLGCLTVVLVSCLVAAIVIPNMDLAPARGRQKRAMSEVRSLATAVQSYEVDNKNAPVPPGIQPGTGWRFVPATDLTSVLCPDYIQQIPDKDFWGQPFLYGITDENPEWFCIISTGSDGQRDSDVLPQALTQTHCWESDIIWQNDSFLQVPDGKQGNCRNRWKFWE
jgi:type II secretory pathway pseudopilin PulG